MFAHVLGSIGRSLFDVGCSGLRGGFCLSGAPFDLGASSFGQTTCFLATGRGSFASGASEAAKRAAK